MKSTPVSKDFLNFYGGNKMKFIRIILLVYLTLSCLMFMNLNLPVLGSYILLKSTFYAIAEGWYFILAVIISILIALLILLILKKNRAFDIMMLALFLVDFAVCFVVLLTAYNYIALQSIIFDILFLAFIFIKSFLVKRKKYEENV